VLIERLPKPADEGAAAGDLAGHLMEGVTARRREAEFDVRRAALIGALLWVGDVVAEQRHVVLEHVVLGGRSAERDR
jgi:hypothetical protein